jgi:hypothetical protein
MTPIETVLAAMAQASGTIALAFRIGEAVQKDSIERTDSEAGAPRGGRIDARRERFHRCSCGQGGCDKRAHGGRLGVNQRKTESARQMRDAVRR